MAYLDELEWQWTLTTAVARFENLRTRDSLAALEDGEGDAPDAGITPLSRTEALELLALGEIIARKAAYGRQLSVRSARAAGASWAQIGQALGTTRQSAWESHTRWLDSQSQPSS
jgi:hypothetical protein